MSAFGAQVATVPGTRTALAALAFCPVGDTVLAIEASRVDGVWDPISEPWRLAPEQAVDLAAHFKLAVNTPDPERRRVDVSIAGQFITFVIDQQLLIERTPPASQPLPRVLAALAGRGVRSIVPFQSQYAFVVDLDRIVQITYPEGG